MRLVDLTGNRYGKLTVIERVPVSDTRKFAWKCACDCGGIALVAANKLVAGTAKACACGNPAKKTHGKTKSRIYRIWTGMLTRCSATNGKDHENYAARGISVDNRWLIFENFLEDMGDPGEGESIERKDNNLGYSKENCRWATCLEQNRNKRNTTFITVGGVTLPLTEWSDLTGINMHTLHARLKKGWSHADVLHTPIRGTRG